MEPFFTALFGLLLYGTSKRVKKLNQKENESSFKKEEMRLLRDRHFQIMSCSHADFEKTQTYFADHYSECCDFLRDDLNYIYNGALPSEEEFRSDHRTIVLLSRLLLSKYGRIDQSEDEMYITPSHLNESLRTKDIRIFKCIETNLRKEYPRLRIVLYPDVNNYDSKKALLRYDYSGAFGESAMRLWNDDETDYAVRDQDRIQEEKHTYVSSILGAVHYNTEEELIQLLKQRKIKLIRDVVLTITIITIVAIFIFKEINVR